MATTIADGLKKLTEDIIASHDVRVKTLADLASDTNHTLAGSRRTVKGFAVDRKKMASQQAKELEGFASGLSKSVSGILKGAQDIVHEFHKSNQQTGREQAKILSGFVSGLTGEVDSLLSDFHKSHQTMARECRSKLETDIKGIRKQVGSILDDADKFTSECRSDMAQARKAWSRMGDVLAGKEKGNRVSPDVKVARHGKKKDSHKSSSSR